MLLIRSSIFIGLGLGVKTPALKLAYLTFLYPTYLASLYARHPGLAERSYDSQLDVVDADSFGWSGAWGPALLPLGYEVAEIYSNVAPLQRAWVREHYGKWSASKWITETTFAQLKFHQPEILFVDDPRTFDSRWLAELRQNCPSLRLVIGFSGSPAYDLDNIKAYDAVLSCTKAYVDLFKKDGCQAFYLRHAFNPAVLSRLPPRNGEVARLSFIGNIIRGAGYHLEREQLLEALVKNIPTDLYCPQNEIGVLQDLLDTSVRRSIYGLMRTLKLLGVKHETCRDLPKIGRAATWTTTPLPQINQHLRRFMKPAVYGLEMYHTMRRSTVTLNKHIDAAGDEAANCRLFETTGVGTCLLTDWKSNLNELFEVDREVVAYRSAEDCVEKARWLLDHPSECEAIAQAGQARTLRNHTFDVRAVELNEVIVVLLKDSAQKLFCYA